MPSFRRASSDALAADHPFQDGNGRVARALATLVFLRAGLFPPVVRDDEDRGDYIRALEDADAGDLAPLVALLARVEKQALLGAIGLSSRVLAEHRDMGQLIAAIGHAAREQEPEGRSDWGAAAGLADGIRRHSLVRLDRVRADLGQALDSSNLQVSTDTAEHGHERAAWYRHDVIAAARQLRYFANLEAYRAWSRLKLVNGRAGLQDEIVIAVHGVGREFRGGVAAVALSIRREQSDESELRERRCVVLGSEPFVLTHRETGPAVIERFERWLEPNLIAGLDRFRRTLTNGA